MLGLALDTWNSIMLLSLGVAALAAIVVGISTYAVVHLQKIEAKDANNTLEQYKTSAAIEISGANKSAAQAGERAAVADAKAAEANLKAETERVERLKLEARLAPRSLTQAQQNDLTAKLSGLEKQIGTVMASPSLPESEWFARVLTAPLRAAGWDMTPVNGTVTATMLQPTGVVIQYALDPSLSLFEQPERQVAGERLAEELNALGIDATAIPGMIAPPMTMQIIITPK